MIFSIFGKKPAEPEPSTPDDERHVRPMQPGDVETVLSIIEEHDEDDAEEAEASFRRSLDGLYVAVDNGRVVGVTGAFDDPESNDIAWLSWTYVRENQRRRGIGRYLVEGLLHLLQQNGVRKIFMSTGEYVEHGEDIYAPAKRFYENLGARLELRMDNYFEAGEPRCVYGLDLADPADPLDAEPLDGDLVFDGLAAAPETDEGAQLTWHQYEQGESGEHPREVLRRLIDEAREEEASFVLAAIPADLAKGASKVMEQLGFKLAGVLKDYYQPGVDQQHWRLDLQRTS